MQGNYQEVIRLRNTFLNKAQTDYNKSERKTGKKICTKKQIEEYKTREKNKLAKMQETTKKYHNEEYLKFLKERR